MLERLTPRNLDDGFRGHRAALWLFVPIVSMRIAISLLHIFSADGGAQSISTMPLDSYPAGASQNVIAMFARMGVEQLVLGILCLVALLRYRALVPLMYALICLQYLADEALARFKPLSLAATSGASTPALVLTVLSIAGLVLSLVGKGYATNSRSTAP